MKRTLILTLALLTLLLPGCAMTAAIGATAWAGVQTISKIVRVVEVVWPDKANEPEPEPEEVEDDGED